VAIAPLMLAPALAGKLLKLFHSRAI